MEDERKSLTEVTEAFIYRQAKSMEKQGKEANSLSMEYWADLRSAFQLGFMAAQIIERGQSLGWEELSDE